MANHCSVSRILPASGKRVCDAGPEFLKLSKNKNKKNKKKTTKPKRMLFFKIDLPLYKPDAKWGPYFCGARRAVSCSDEEASELQTTPLSPSTV